jgi:uncharacterized coiled-coil DUF342 family protein
MTYPNTVFFYTFILTLTQLNSDLVDHLEQITELRAGLDGVLNNDYSKQIKESNNEIANLQDDLKTLNTTVNTYIEGDLKSINVKISLLQVGV